MSTSANSPLSPNAILESLEVHALRPPDFGGLVQLVAGANLHYLCLAPGHLRRASQQDTIDWTQGTVVARLGELVVGFGLIERGNDPHTAQLTIGIETAYARGPVAERLVHATSRVARELGIQKLETQIFRHTTEAFASFRDAGMRIVASMCLGGVTDVTLALV
ncbi:MAG: hypothetical protein LC118_12765 [Dehalococcoidia bacterium]|nr:hypothetical protein [Dehalococcoidia bacterium]